MPKPNSETPESSDLGDNEIVTSTEHSAVAKSGLSNGVLVDETIAALGEVTAALGAKAEIRQGQIDMAAAVARSIETGEHLVVQAGTGTGKSLAYLIPLALSSKRCVVATATKALQDQIANKEMPHLAATLEHSPSWAVLKGRSNYLCAQRLSEVTNEIQGTLDGVGAYDSEEVAQQVAKLIDFSENTVTGERSELDFEPLHQAWAAVSVTSQECPGRSRCPSGDSCFVERARDIAAESDIVIVNTHLLGLDLISDGAILPEHDLVVIDEAHQLEDTATSTFGWTISQSRFFWLARTLNRVVATDSWSNDLNNLGLDLSEALEPYVDQRLEADQIEKIASELLAAREKVVEVQAVLKELPKPDDQDLAARKIRAEQACVSMIEELDAVQPSDAFVAWVSRGPGNSPSLHIAPLDVAPILRPRLFDENTVVLTSATINEASATRVGLRRGEHVRLEVDSPFDYENNALLFCPIHLAEPRMDRYESEMLGLMTEMIFAAGGRTLGLFTSWRMMDIAKDHLSRALDTPILTQRDMPKPALIEAFREDESATLLATLGFWQGIDIAGPTLSLVTIDRLPFPRPNDPLHSARRDRAGRYAFAEIDLPRCATLLAQGVGRLIRTSTDRGVVAVLDSRLATKKSYRWDLVRALPPMRRTRETAEVLQYLRSLND